MCGVPGVVPDVVSVDGGCASKANAKEAKRRCVRIISNNRTKLEALTSTNDWERDEHALACDKRSAVESLVFTLQQGLHFGEVARRGII